jgi:hypothetical protein
MPEMQKTSAAGKWARPAGSKVICPEAAERETNEATTAATKVTTCGGPDLRRSLICGGSDVCEGGLAVARRVGAQPIRKTLIPKKVAIERR